MISSNFALARRMEMTEAAVGRMTAEAFGVVAEPIAGGIALFTGVGSPLTHALGIGMNGPVLLSEMDRLEEFFRERESPCLIDLCAMADTTVIGAVMDRRYRIVELNNVMVRRLNAGETFESAPGIREIAPEEGDLWARTVLQGFMGDLFNDEALQMMGPMCRVGVCHLAFQEERPVAGCAMAVHEGVAALFGDSTLPEARGKGIQQALIRTRLTYALAQGCDLAMASVLPGSSSHRNYERCGFQLAYMRLNVAL